VILSAEKSIFLLSNPVFHTQSDRFVRPFLIPFVSVLVLLLTSCSGPSRTTKESSGSAPAQPKLATTVRMATLDLYNLKRRIEKKDIDRFAEMIKKEQIDVLAVQGISRYPNVKTRIDFVEEFPGRADMRRAFGESIDMSGQQRVNAVFSIYPIQWSNKAEYDVPSAFYESALQVSIDAGVKDVVIVSTRLPEKLSAKDLGTCIQVIAGLQMKTDKPFIVTGNLPILGKVKAPESLADIQSLLAAEASKAATSQLWYTQGDLFKPLNARTVKTDLGVMTVVEFGIYQPILPQ
jgi:endonuclease/exonuclease/phosphatase family metal-dependent hydrolase